jgi:hypothetical protein
VAEVLEAFPEPARRSRYPWDEWLDGRVWRLRQGQDFEANPKTIRSRLQQNARKRGGRARTLEQHEGETVYVIVQFRRPNGGQLAA